MTTGHSHERAHERQVAFTVLSISFKIFFAIFAIRPGMFSSVFVLLWHVNTYPHIHVRIFTVPLYGNITSQSTFRFFPTIFTPFSFDSLHTNQNSNISTSHERNKRSVEAKWSESDISDQLRFSLYVGPVPLAVCEATSRHKQQQLCHILYTHTFALFLEITNEKLPWYSVFIVPIAGVWLLTAARRREPSWLCIVFVGTAGWTSE